MAQPADAPTLAPALSPVARIPLHTDQDGSYAGPAVELDSAHSLVYIRQPVSNTGVWGWVSWHAPTLALVGAPLILIALLMVVVRTCRRRQEYGHYYCRACNYDLTGPGGMPPEAGEQSRCPECGVELARRAARLGRSGTQRLWKPVAAGVLAMGACATVMWITLEPLLPGTGSQPWLGEVAGVLRMPRLQRHRDFGWDHHRVTAYSMARGERVRSFDVSMQAFGDAGVSPDGRWFVALLGSNMGGSGEVLIRELESGKERRVRIGIPNAMQQLVAGFSGDSAKAYIHTIEDPNWPPGPSGSGFRAVLREMDIASGAFAVVATVNSSYTVTSPNSRETPTQRFAVRECGGRLRWALYMDRGRGTGGGAATVKAEVITDAGADYSIEFPGTSWYEPRLSEDGGTLIVPTYGTGGVANVRLADGALTLAPGSMAPDSVGGGLTLRLVSAGAAGKGTIHVLDRSGATVATLDPGAGLSAWQGVISRDGRLAAAVTHEQGTSLLGGAVLHPKVLVWDLSSLTTEREK